MIKSNIDKTKTNENILSAYGFAYRYDEESGKLIFDSQYDMEQAIKILSNYKIINLDK